MNNFVAVLHNTTLNNSNDWMCHYCSHVNPLLERFKTVSQCQTCGMPNPSIQQAKKEKACVFSDNVKDERDLVLEKQLPDPEEMKEFPDFPRNSFLKRYYQHNVEQYSPLNVSNDVVKLISSYLEHGFEIGDEIYAKDMHGKWYLAKIANLALGSRVKVHYHGWSSKWDEWIELSSGRITTLDCPPKEEIQNKNSREVLQIEENEDQVHVSAQHVELLVSMGFDEEAVIQALRVHRNNPDSTLNSLLEFFTS